MFYVGGSFALKMTYMLLQQTFQIFSRRLRAECFFKLGYKYQS